MADIRQIRLRRDTAAAFTDVVGEDGEPFYEKDTKRFRVGDGQHKVPALPAAAFVDGVSHLFGDDIMAALTRLFGSASDRLGHVQGVAYAAYGHSFGQVQNPVNTTSGGLYPNRVLTLASTDATKFANYTVSGASIDAIAARAQATWVQGTYGLVTMMGNQNTVGNSHADINAEANYKAALRSFLNWVRGGTTFPPTVVLVRDTTCTSVGYARYSPPPTDADVIRFNRYLDQVAAEYPSDGSILVADAFDGWDPATMTAPDGQHPNDRGSAHIADAILDALAAADFREGLNRGIAPASQQNFAVQDTFTRADNPTSLGTTETGQAWVVPASGAAFGVVSGQAKSTTSLGENGYAWVESSLANFDMSVVLGGDPFGPGFGPAFRMSDINNGFCVDCQVTRTDGGGFTLYRRQNSSYTQIGAATVQPKIGDTVRVVGSGSNITVFLNGTQVIAATDAFNQAATKHGFRSTDQRNSINSITVAKL